MSEVLHVVPRDDFVDHDTSTSWKDCVCGPDAQLVPRPDGSFGGLLVHHALDGRI